MNAEDTARSTAGRPGTRRRAGNTQKQVLRTEQVPSVAGESGQPCPTLTWSPKLEKIVSRTKETSLTQDLN